MDLNQYNFKQKKYLFQIQFHLFKSFSFTIHNPLDKAQFIRFPRLQKLFLNLLIKTLGF